MEENDRPDDVDSEDIPPLPPAGQSISWRPRAITLTTRELVFLVVGVFAVLALLFVIFQNGDSATQQTNAERETLNALAADLASHTAIAEQLESAQALISSATLATDPAPATLQAEGTQLAAQNTQLAATLAQVEQSTSNQDAQIATLRSEGTRLAQAQPEPTATHITGITSCSIQMSDWEEPIVVEPNTEFLSLEFEEIVLRQGVDSFIYGCFDFFGENWWIIRLGSTQNACRNALARDDNWSSGEERYGYWYSSELRHLRCMENGELEAVTAGSRVSN